MSYGSGDVEEYRILVIGKSGNGRSTLCNAIIGETTFTVGRGLTTTTTTADCATVLKGNKQVKVIDTPDITNCGMTDMEMRDEVEKWRRMTLARPSAVVLTVRCDVRYTAEEHAVYKKIMALWGDNSLKDRLVVAFTFGDKQDTPLEEELKTVCPELKSVLRDAGQIYILFDKTSEQSRNGVWYDIVNAIQSKELARGRQSGRAISSTKAPLISSKSMSSRATPILIGLLFIAVIFVIVFAVLKYVGVAIGFGIFGLILVCVILLLVYFNRSKTGSFA